MLNRILLVDDSEGEALLVKQKLRQAGLDDPIYWLADAEEAMCYFNGEGKYADRRKFPIPEIVLLDLGMPNVDGYSFLRWLRAQPELTGTQVIVLTGEMDPKRIQMAYQLGATSYLAKDSELEEFRNFVLYFREFSRVAHSMPVQLPDIRSKGSNAA